MPPAARRSLLSEWPTWGLIATIYGGWISLTLCFHTLPLPVATALGAWLIAWHMSLQHELLHGHPTRNRRLNDALGFPPLTLWLPYAIYRERHLRHHRDEHLTDPVEDTESPYLTPAAAAALPAWSRTMIAVNATLVGRLTIGPARTITGFLKREWRRAWRAERGTRRLWAWHGVGVALVLGWVWGVCAIDPLTYVACFVYPGLALAQIRGFAEHRAAARPEERTAIVENAPVLGLLFLFNNLHVVHHRWPGTAWYRLPGLYKMHRAAILAGPHGPVYDGYWDVLRRYGLRQHDSLVHPAYGPSEGSASPASAMMAPLATS